MYGVHTLIINQQLSIPQADKLNNELGIKKGFIGVLEHLKEGKTYIFNLKPLPLIRKSDVTIVKRAGKFYIYFRLHLAPLDIVTGTTTEDVFEASKENIKLFLANLNDILTGYFDGYIDTDYHKFNVSYIEYAANLYSDNIELVLEMLLKNAKDVNLKAFKDDDGKTTCTISRKSKYKRNSSFTTYDKEKAEYAKHPERLIETGDEIQCIRFERQCGRNYLWSSIAKKQHKNDNLTYYLKPEVIEHVLATTYNQKYAVGNFYDLDTLRKIIDVKNLKGKKKLITYAESATKSRSIKCTKIKTRSGKSSISAATNNNRINAFDELGIAPVAIPARKHVKYLKNPVPDSWLADKIQINKGFNYVIGYILTDYTHDYRKGA